VLELAEGWAGPMGCMWLADLGAEVIKVEAIQRYDHTRGPVAPPEGLTSYPGKKPGKRPWDVNAPYVQGNRGKRSATIDLSRPEGVELFKRLVVTTDVVFTNMVTGVPEKMGIGYEVLRRVRPDLIMLLSSGYGASGPYARRVTMGGAMDGIAGYSWLRHYPDQTPDTITYSMHTDIVTGMTNSMAVLMAIHHRRRTGKGVLIETSGVEASIHHIHGALMDYALNGRVRTSVGDDHPWMAPHGCYPCQGNDRWITIAVWNDVQWQALRRVMGDPSTGSGQAPAWAQDARFDSPASRWAHRDELNERLAEWTRAQEHIELMHRLQRAGVPAGAVYDQRENTQDPHWKARGVYQQARLGDGDYAIATSPWIVDGKRLGVGHVPPAFAQHNPYVFAGLLGLGDRELASLHERQLIGEEPLNIEI
jgi:benzylsuccinate CoA-transferase BbsF subunit